MKHRNLVSSLALLCSMPLVAQLQTNTTLTPAQLVEDILLGGGVTVSNITYNGVAVSTPQAGSGAFSNGNTTNLGLDAGIVLSTGYVDSIPGPASYFGNDILGTGSDPDLVAITTPGNTIQDKSVLEFDFIPTGDSLKFSYVFGSEEYPSFSCSPNYNDVFGFFLSGPGITGPFTNNAINIALVPGTNLPVSIANIHGDDGLGCGPANAEYYVNNAGGTTITLNGFTTVLQALAEVICGETYHIKLAIGDAGDSSYNSAVFLQAGSFASTAPIVPGLVVWDIEAGGNDSTLMAGCGGRSINFVRTGDISGQDTAFLVVGGTAVPGVDYEPQLPDIVVFEPGETLVSFPLTVPYNPGFNGPLTIEVHVAQTAACSGVFLEHDYVFYINQHPELELTTADVDGVCEESYTIGPTVTGGSGLYQYVWNVGDTTATIEVQTDVTTSYTVTVSDVCDLPDTTATIVVNMPVYEPVAVDAGPETAIPCLGSSTLNATATGGNGDYSFAWSLGGQPVGNGPSLTIQAGDTAWYRVDVEDGCSKTGADSVLTYTIPLPPIEILSYDTTVFCTGDTVVLRPLGVTGGNGVYSYSWHDLSGQVLSTADTLEVAVPGDASYVLHVHDQCSNAADSIFTTRYPRYAPLHIDLPLDTTICAGDSVLLWARVSGGSGVYTIDWQGQEWSDPKFQFTGDENTAYIVEVVEECGSFARAATFVEVQHAQARILVHNQGEESWLFQATTVPAEVPIMMWDMGDDPPTRHKDVTSVRHSYMDLEEHMVKLQIVSEQGCRAVDSLLVKPPATIFFPNAFTPDGDGINDTFGPVQASIHQFQMTIFNRWGHVVFQTEDVNHHWDGTTKGGELAPTGVYVYKYKASGHYFEAEEKYGHITLIRGTTNH